jgi:hypothetical protein
MDGGVSFCVWYLYDLLAEYGMWEWAGSMARVREIISISSFVVLKLSSDGW